VKRGGYIQRRTPLKTKTRIKAVGNSDTAILKDQIQSLVRAIVIKRDGGCIFRAVYGVPACNGFRLDGEPVLQADHLITRANSATYADTRLIVCVCKGHHGWKNWHQKEYEAVVRRIISHEREALWDRCEQDSWRPKRTSAMDWKLAIAALKQELRQVGQIEWSEQ
jgi:hypothetical protein